MNTTTEPVESSWMVEHAANLKLARLKAGMTQKDLASSMAVAQPTISQWETAKDAPDASQIAQLEELLHERLTETDGSSPAGGDVQTDLALWLRKGMDKKKEKGVLSVAAMAAEATVSVPTIYNILNGSVTAPQHRTIEKLKTYFGATELPDEVREEAEDAGRLGQLGDFQEFDPYDKDNWPNEPGVYILYDIAKRPAYIGKSKNSIAERLRDHETRFWYKSPLVDGAAFISVKQADLVLGLERVLIKVLGRNAVLNKVGVVPDADDEGA